MPSTNGKRGTPHHRLTLKDVARDYKSELLTVKGAVFYAVSSSRKPGQPVRIDPRKFAEQLGVHKATVYKAIARLQLEDRIEFETEGTLLLKVPIEEKTGIPRYIFLEELSQKCDSQTQKCDSQTQKCDSQTQKCDKKSSEPPPRNGSEDAQLYTTKTTGSFKEREGEAEIDPEFRKWLLNRANSLPQKPALTEQWIEAQAKNAANQREYAQYLNTRERAAIPPIPQSEEITNQAEYWKRVQERMGGDNAQT